LMILRQPKENFRDAPNHPPMATAAGNSFDMPICRQS
jgi:hypothetical protein